MTQIAQTASTTAVTFRYALLCLCITLVLIALTGVASLVWFAYEVPITYKDISRSSWWFSTNPAYNHIANSFSAKAMLFLVVITALASRKVLGVITAAAILITFLANTPQAQLRMGILSGSIKIGCYVEHTFECQTMLGLPSTGKTIHASVQPALSTKVYADWYMNAAQALPNKPSQLDIKPTSLPAGAVIQAIRYMIRIEDLQILISVQRAALSRITSPARS